jgi:hypothetical protein
MSAIANYIAENNITKSSGDNSQVSINMPVRITGYAPPYFLGIRMDKNEEVKIKLRPVEVEGKYSRIEVEDFSNANGKRYCEPNKSIVAFDNCYAEEDGSINSRWATMLTKPMKESKIIVVDANVSFVTNAKGGYVEVAVMKEKELIDSPESLNRFMTKVFTAKVPRSRACAHFVFTDSSGQHFDQDIYPATVEMDANGVKFKEMDTPENSIDAFYANDRKSKIVLDMIADAAVTVVCYSVSKLFLGADTKDKIMERPSEIDRFKADYSVDTNGEISDKGFKKTVLALKTRPDNSMFIAYVKPLVNNMPAKLIHNLR